MFENCTELKSLDLTTFDTSWCRDFSYMFANCIKIENININNFNTKLIRDMSYMFSNCTSLETVNVSSFDTSTLTTMDYMFSYSGVKNLDLSSFNTLNIKKFNGVFEKCYGLNLILIEKNSQNLITTIPDYVNITLL